MAGVTDGDFRRIVRRIGGVGVVAMEFVSARGLVAGERRWQEVTAFAPEERPLAMQIYGADAATMAAAAREVEALAPDLCDINMGCPANKILKNCAGAGLMRDLRAAEQIVRAVRRELSIPLTVKFRLGIDETSRNYLELARLCEANGVDAVVLHARTARQMFRGEARWEEIARLKEACRIPVIGNGDVRTAEDALRLFAATGCDGVMIGRGATRNPWLFRQIAARLAGGRVSEPTPGQRRDLILDHFRTVLAREPENRALHKLRTFTGLYALGLPGGQSLRRQIQSFGAPEELLAAVERFFAEHAAAA